jgi:transcriptional regulator with XRE-family HTH domain
MSKVTKARKYNSAKLQDLLDEVTPLEMEQAKHKMLLAASIEDLMIAKKWSKSQFAQKVGKNPSEITKWLSGTQNFTIDVLTEIASALGVELASLFSQEQVQVVYRNAIDIKVKDISPEWKMPTPSMQAFSLLGTCFYSTRGTVSAYPKSYQA